MSFIQPVQLPEATRGPWIIKHQIIEDDVTRLRLLFDGRSPGNPGDRITMLVHRQRGVVMSDTAAERRDHSYFVRMATGHVLINGLGLGMCLAAILRKPEVTKATVVELDPDVIALVGPHYTDPRVEIVNASAFDYQPPKDVRYGAVWHDIWDTICADNLPEMTRLHRKYGRRCDWQGSWARFECERRRLHASRWY